MQTQRQALRQNMPRPSASSPLGLCGANGYLSNQFVIDGNTIYADLSYYLSRNCSQAVLNYTQSEDLTYYNSLDWCGWHYSSGWPGVWSGSEMGCETIAPPGSWRTVSINKTVTPNYVFQEQYCLPDDPSGYECKQDGEGGLFVDLGTVD